MATQSGESEGIPLRSYLNVLRQWLWVLLAALAVGLGAAAAYTFTRTPLYTATAQIIYERQLDIGNPLSQSYTDTTERQAELESIPTVITSGEVVAKADEILGPRASEPYSVSAALELGVDDTYTNVVGIVGTAPSPQTAAAVANAYSQAFIDWRRESVREQIDRAIAVVQTRLKTFDTPEERATTEYANLQSLLEDLTLLKQTATGNFRTLSSASPPSAPSSPNHSRSIAVGGVLGLVAGLALVFLLAQFDTRIRDESQIVDLLSMPVLGRMPAMTRRNGENGVLLTLSEPGGPAAEAFRLLRSNLEFMGVEQEIGSLLVSSSVQREHKSVTACNLAVSLALTGKRVVLVDGDLRSPRVHAYMELGNAVGVSSVIARRATLMEALQRVTLSPAAAVNPAAGVVAASRAAAGGRPAEAGLSAGSAARTAKPAVPAAAVANSPALTRSGRAPQAGPRHLWSDVLEESAVLYVLTSGPLPPNPGELVGGERFGAVIEELTANSDIVIVDAPAMLVVGDTAALAGKVDAMIYVVDPEMVRRPMLEEAGRQLAQLPCRKLGLVIVSSRVGRGSYGYRSYYYHRGDYKHRGSRGHRRA